MEKLDSLVKRLNKAEKRYFKLMANLQQGDKKYLELFNMYDNLANPNEKELLNNFDSQHSFNHNKKYLYQQLIGSLRQYHSKTVKARCNAFLEELDILRQKSLYKLMYKRLVIAKRFGTSFEQFEFLLQLVTYEHTHISLTSNKDYSKKTAEISNYLQHLTKKLQNLYELSAIQIRIANLGKKRHILRTEEELEEVLNFLENPLLKNPDLALSKRAMVRYINSHRIVSGLLNQHKKRFEYAQMYVDLYEQNPFLIDIQPNYYLVGLSDLAKYMVKNKKYAEAEKLIGKAEKLKGTSIRSEIFFLNYLSNPKVQLLDAKGDWDAVKKHFEVLETTLGKLRPFMEKQWTLVHDTNLIFYYFSIKNFEKSLNLIEILFKTGPKNMRLDLYAMLYFVKLFALYELKKYVEIIDTTEVIYKKLHRKKSNFKLELYVLHFFKNTPFAIGGKKELRQAFIDFESTTMQMIKENELNKGLFASFELEVWIKEKIQELKHTKV